MPISRRPGVICAAGALLLVATAAHGEGERVGVAEEIDPTINLEQLLDLRVVTASSGVAEERSLAPASVVVFTDDDIARHGWRSVAEVLENVPGFDVTDDHVLASVGVRGVTGGFRASTRIVKVMIDGLAVSFRPDLAAFVGPEYIPIEAVERIEIAKGPLSAIYGANAFVAVVNVITRKGPDAPVATVRLRPNLIHAGPGYGVSALIAERRGPVELIAAFSTDRLDRSGLGIDRTFAAQDPSQARYANFFAGPSQDDVAQPRSAFVALRVPSASWGSLTLEGGLQQLDSMAEFQLSSVLTHRSRMAVDNFWSQARYDKSWSDRFRLGAVIGYAQGSPSRDEILYLTGNYDSSFTRNFGYQAVDVGVQGSYAPSSRVSLVLGADGSYEPQRVLYYTQTFQSAQGTNVPGDRVDLIGATDARTALLSSAGVYAQLGATPFARLASLRLTLNGRIDVPNLFPAQYSWRAAAAYRLGPSVTTKIFAGRAFQTPSAVLLYGHPGFGAANNVIGSLTVPGRAPLRPQSIDSLEAAVGVSLANFLTFETNAYYQETHDRIEFLQAGSDFLPRNAGTGKNVGMEASAQAVLRRFLRPYAAVAAQRTLVNGALDGDPPPLYPNYWLRGGLDIEAPERHVRSAIQVRWVGPRTASQSNVLLNNNVSYELPAFAEVDVAVSTVGWRPFRSGPELMAAVSVRNLLDDRRPVPGFGGMDIPALGRVAMVELGYSH